MREEGWRKIFINKIVLGNSKERLKEIPDSTIDIIVTDPPYGISFMGKGWDSFEKKKGLKKSYGSTAMIEFFIPIWKECLRILKSGAFVFVMCSPRQDVLCKQILALRNAGFEMGFTSIYWTYASGFPKALNIGKAVDKKLGIKSKVIGKDKTWGRHDSGRYNFNSGNVSPKNEFNITKATSSQAKALDGSYGGFQPKPAIEVILVAMKPLSEKTYVSQALKNRKGITWLDDCKIPSGREHFRGNVGNKKEDTVWKCQSGFGGSYKATDDPRGRFPANLLVSNDVLNDGRTISYGKRTKPYSYQSKRYKVEGFIKDNSLQAPSNYADSGSFSRYFDLDKWFKRKIRDLPESVQRIFPFLIVPKASKKERNRGCENGNNHPTCKPIKLMSYLITLGSRAGDVVLDPFVGSGTTCIAAKMTGRKYIGIDNKNEYVEIGRARLKVVAGSLF